MNADFHRVARLTARELCGIIAKERSMAHEHRLREATRPLLSRLRWLDRQAALDCDALADAAVAELRRRTEETYNNALLVAGLERSKS